MAKTPTVQVQLNEIQRTLSLIVETQVKLNEQQNHTDRRLEDVFDMVKDIRYGQEEAIEEEGEFIIKAASSDDSMEDVYYRGDLQGEDEPEVWDSDHTKARVYRTMANAEYVLDQLEGPYEDYNFTRVVIERKNRKVGPEDENDDEIERKKGWKVKTKDEDSDDEEDLNSDFTYFISTAKTSTSSKKFPRFFWQEGDLGNQGMGDWVKDWKHATHYPSRASAQRAFDYLDNYEDDDYPAAYPPAKIVKMDKKGKITPA